MYKDQGASGSGRSTKTHPLSGQNPYFSMGYISVFGGEGIAEGRHTNLTYLTLQGS